MRIREPQPEMTRADRRLPVLILFCLCFAISLPSLATQVEIKTSLGSFVVELDEEKAPVSVANFLAYVDAGAYTDTIFHRVIPGFMVQGGGHYRDMSEAEDGETIFNEAANGLKNLRGTIAMARFDEIDSASRQFFINAADNDFLDHKPTSCTREDMAAEAAARARGLRKPRTCDSYGYAVFGRVVSGMDIVDLIEFTETRDVASHQDVPVVRVVILSIDRVR